VSAKIHRRYGGNTTCFEVEVESRHHLIVDCGTGLRGLQRDIGGDTARRFSIFFTHYHWDHIEGLALFEPLFDPRATIDFHGPRSPKGGVEDTLRAVLQPPWWPVSLHEAAATVSFLDLDSPVAVGPVSMSHAQLSHPQGVVSYRLDGPSRSVVIATDHEAGDATLDARLSGLASRADVLIHDAQYTPKEYRSSRKGWGHSTWEMAVRAALDARVKHLVLTSHDPERSDEGVDTIRAEARSRFPQADAAWEGMRIAL
jgi:phosphoribosyl 1,2-cyclic phosphodiesterase